MAAIYFRSVPFDKHAVTLALESGVDGVIVPASEVDLVSGLALCDVIADEDLTFHTIETKQDEEDIAESLRAGRKIVLAPGWEIIPVENLLAQSDFVMAEVENSQRAKLASGILEKGVAAIVVPAKIAGELKEIIAQCKISQGQENLLPAVITRVEKVGLGHRVCLDTLSIMQRGQGALIGNSSAFLFLVHAETEHNEYVASRPFRINAGAVHAYIKLPHDKTGYLAEMGAGKEILVVDASGESTAAIIGRVKIESRPMLLVEAEITDADGRRTAGSIFLQNAETIRLTGPGGVSISVVNLKPGDEVLCHVDNAGRHFGMRVKEDIREV